MSFSSTLFSPQNNSLSTPPTALTHLGFRERHVAQCSQRGAQSLGLFRQTRRVQLVQGVQQVLHKGAWVFPPWGRLLLEGPRGGVQPGVPPQPQAELFGGEAGLLVVVGVHLRLLFKYTHHFEASEVVAAVTGM